MCKEVCTVGCLHNRFCQLFKGCRSINAGLRSMVCRRLMIDVLFVYGSCSLIEQLGEILAVSRHHPRVCCSTSPRCQVGQIVHVLSTLLKSY